MRLRIFSSPYPFLCASVVILMVTIRAATDLMIITTSRKPAKANRRTTTRMYLAKTFYVCLLYDVGVNRQPSRVCQGQDRCLSLLKIDGFVQSQPLVMRSEYVSFHRNTKRDDTCQLACPKFPPQLADRLRFNSKAIYFKYLSLHANEHPLLRRINLSLCPRMKKLSEGIQCSSTFLSI